MSDGEREREEPDRRDRWQLYLGQSECLSQYAWSVVLDQVELTLSQ